MAKEKRSRGRPKLPASERKRISLNVKTTEAVRATLDKAAEASGRSLAQEVEYRLTISVRDEDFLEGFLQDGELVRRIQDMIGAKRALEKFLYPDSDVAQTGAQWSDPVFLEVMSVIARICIDPEDSSGSSKPVAELLDDYVAHASSDESSSGQIADKMYEQMRGIVESGISAEAGPLLGYLALLHTQLDALERKKVALSALTADMPTSLFDM